MCECLSTIGRKRTRILTYIFKHIDQEKIGEISFESVMEFDLLLVPNATQEMIKEDANLFFDFADTTNADMVDEESEIMEKSEKSIVFSEEINCRWMNMIDWLDTWRMAVIRGSSIKVIDNFFEQYFNTFEQSRFRLSVIGVTWP